MGLDRAAAKEAFDRTGTAVRAPFTAFHYEGVEGAFAGADTDGIFRVIEEINSRAAA